MTVDDKGYIIIKHWGDWELQITPDCTGMLIEGPKGYWIGDDRWHEADWESHMQYRNWVYMPDFMEALTFCRKLSKTKRRSMLNAAKLLVKEDVYEDDENDAE